MAIISCSLCTTFARIAISNYCVVILMNLARVKISAIGKAQELNVLSIAI